MKCIICGKLLQEGKRGCSDSPIPHTHWNIFGTEMKQKTIKGLSKEEYFKAYREAKQKHQKEHPEEYLKVLGTKVYTNGVTKEMEKQLPKLIDKKIKEMLDEIQEDVKEELGRKEELWKNK